MTGDGKHHLLLREEEVRLVLQALEQFEPRDLRCAVPKGRHEQLARTIQRGCGITLDPHGQLPGGELSADRSSEKPGGSVPATDCPISTDGGPPTEE